MPPREKKPRDPLAIEWSFATIEDDDGSHWALAIKCPKCGEDTNHLLADLRPGQARRSDCDCGEVAVAFTAETIAEVYEKARALAKKLGDTPP